MPLYALCPPAITPTDERLKDPSYFNHKWESWKSVYKADIFEHIKEHGQIDPNIALYENNRWRIEPGQARWLAMNYLGVETQKVILCVRPEDDASQFMQYDHEEHTVDTLPDLFKDRGEHRGFDYIYRRFLRSKK